MSRAKAMRMTIIAASIAALSARARADDAMFVNLGGSIGVGTSVDGQNHFGLDYETEGTLQARVMLSWDPPPLPYREPRGYRWRGAFVPEVMFGYLHVADHRTGDPSNNGDAFIALGGRFELGFSQHRGGLLELTARGGFTVAGRVGLLTDADRTPLAELAVGEYLWFGDRTKVGFELGAERIFGEQYTVFANGRTPWSDGDGQYLSVQLSAYVGLRL